MADQKDYWQRLQQKIDQLSQRERVIIFATAAVMLLFIVQLLLIDPLLNERSSSQREIRQLQAQTNNQRNEMQLISAQIAAGVNRAKEQRREQLMLQVQQLDERIESSVVTMIPPQMMTTVLERVLSDTSDLRLMALENLPVEKLLEQVVEGAIKPATAEPKLGLYRHRFVLTLQGTYPATIHYFEKLNELPWRFHWDSLNYEVTDYPNATIRLQVHTVSRSEDWIGV